MIEAIAIVLFIVTVVAWVRVAGPQLVAAWVGFAQDLDPSLAPQHAILFAPVPPPPS